MSQGKEGEHFKIPLHKTRNLSELCLLLTQTHAHTHTHARTHSRSYPKGSAFLKAQDALDSAGNGVVPSPLHWGSFDWRARNGVWC